MDRFKECPACGFQAALRARSCARCSHFFDDVPPLEVRDEVLRRAHRQLDEFPEADRTELEDRLLRSIQEDPRLVAAARAGAETAARPGDGVLPWLRAAAQALGLEEDPARDRLKVAVEAAVDELLSEREGHE